MAVDDTRQGAIDPLGSPSARRRQLAPGVLFRRVRWYVVVLVLFGVVWWLSTVMPPATATDAGSALTGEGALVEPSAMLPRIAQAGSAWIAALVQMLAEGRRIH